jgi:hypothetical protein
MSGQAGDGPQTITHEQWLQIVSQCDEADEGMGVKREDTRRHASVIATVRMPDNEGVGRRFLADLIQVSENGCMLKTNRELERGTQLAIECCFDDETVVLLEGQVVHSTTTVGGFKTGVQLSFG